MRSLAAGLVASALQTGHSAAQIPDLPALGRLPDFSSDAQGQLDISAAIDNIPSATSFFRDHMDNRIDTAAFRAVGPAPAPAGSPAGAPAGPPKPLAATDGKVFQHKVSRLLTCEELEKQVDHECGTSPLFSAIHQFGGQLALCNKAVEKIGELGPLFAEYFGQGANCNTMMDAWKFNGHLSVDDCKFRIRKDDFSQ